MNNPFTVFILIYILFALAAAVAGTLYIVIMILYKSNNIGDSYGSFNNYVKSDIHSDIWRDDITWEIGRQYLIRWGESPFENDNSEAPAPLKANDDDIYGELEEVDIPLFKPLT